MIIRDYIVDHQEADLFTHVVETGTDEKTITFLIGSISIKDFFNNDVNEFYERYKNEFGARFNIDLNFKISEANIQIVKFEQKFRSDGVLLSERDIQFNDIIDVYATVKIPIQYEKKIEIENFFHLDLNPTPGHQHTVINSDIYHHIPVIGQSEQEKNEIKAMSSEVNSVIEVPSKELLVRPINIYMRPYAIRRVEPDIIDMHGEIIQGTEREYVLFHTDEDFWFNPKDYRYDPTMLRLGKVIVQANSTMKDDMIIIDTRTRGGGLDEGLSKDLIKQINKESMYHWDIGYFDGEAYQENGVIIIRLPRRILKSETNPNGFHESYVEQVVAKYKAFGVLPIIEYIDEPTYEGQMNLLSNYEFLNGKHIGYYDPVRSKQPYAIIQEKVGSGDNYVLKIEDTGEYAITIPAYRFKSNRYELNIKIMKDQDTNIRSIGQVEIFYKNGSREIKQLGNINRNQWMVYKEFFTLEPDKLHHITITLNKTDENRNGSIYVDYVLLFPKPEYEDSSYEIYEF